MPRIDEKEKLITRIKERLAIMSWQELRDVGINGQQAMKIKNGEEYRLYDRTIERLRTAFGL
jgi:hypothetical protein